MLRARNVHNPTRTSILTVITMLVFASPGLCANTLQDIVPCEKYISFVDPEDSFAKEWLPERKELRHWSVSYKRAICHAFINVQHKAPGLVARACNGQSVHFILNRTSPVETIAMTDPLSITCYANILDDLDRGLEEHVTHELVHTVDTSNRLSDTREWNQLVGPYLQRFRASHSNFDDVFWHSVDPAIAHFGLPSSFAALSPEEALAEYTTAMVMGIWNPPDGIKSFIVEKILSEPTTVNVEQDLLRQAYAYLHNDNYQKSICLYTQVLKSNRVSVPAYLGLAFAWTNSAEPELGIFHAREALNLLRQNGAPSYSGDFKYCLECLAADYYNLAQCHREAKQYKQAIDDYSQAISLNLKNPQAYGHRALAYSCLGQHRKELDDLTKAIHLDPKCVEFLNNRGCCFDELGQYQQALDDYNKCIALHSKIALVFCNRANDYGRLGQYQKAIDDSNNAITLDPSDAASYDTRGFAYKRLGQYQRAFVDFSKAITIDPHFSLAFAHRALADEKLGKLELAIKDRKMAKEWERGQQK